MKFAVWLLVVIAVLALFALVLEEFLPVGASQSNIISLFQLSDPFRSLWFRIILGLLTLSLTVCIIERGPKLIKQAIKISLINDIESLEKFNSYIQLEMLNGEKRVVDHFRSLRLKIRSEAGDEKVIIGASSGRISRLGPLLSHLGMLLLIIGGLIVSLTGQSFQLRGSAGETLKHPDMDFNVLIKDFEIIYHPIAINQWVELSDGRRGKIVSLSGDSAQVRFSHGSGNLQDRWTAVDSVKNNFLLSRNGQLTPYQGNVKSYVTHAVIVDAEEEQSQTAIEVNHPLRYRGYRFYQSSFETGGAKSIVDTVSVRIQRNDTDLIDVDLCLAVDTVSIWDDYIIVAERFLPDFRLDLNMQPFSASGDLNNPALQVSLFKDSHRVGKKWIFNRPFGHMGGDDLPFTIQIIKLGGIETSRAGYVTVLDVKREKGGFFIWMGILFATIGVILIYGLQFRQVWAVIVNNKDERCTIHLAANCRKTDSRFLDSFKNLRSF